MRVIDFCGGLYAVASLNVKSGEEIPGYWKELKLWCEDSKYSFASHQWLEEHSSEGEPINIYMPIKE